MRIISQTVLEKKRGSITRARLCKYVITVLFFDKKKMLYNLHTMYYAIS